jgi:hypothetical protein
LGVGVACEQREQEEGDSHSFPFGLPRFPTFIPATRMARVTPDGLRPYFFAAERAVCPRPTHLRASFIC